MPPALRTPARYPFAPLGAAPKGRVLGLVLGSLLAAHVVRARIWIRVGDATAKPVATAVDRIGCTADADLHGAAIETLLDAVRLICRRTAGSWAVPTQGPVSVASAAATAAGVGE